MEESQQTEKQNFSFIEAARRAQIIENTIETLAELGYAQTSLARIAKKVGIAKSVISYYFAGKDALMWAVIVHIYTHIGQFMWSRMEKHSSPRDMLKAYIESNLAYVKAYPTYGRALDQIVNNHVGKLSDEQPDDDPGIEPLRGLLQAGQEAEEFRAFDTLPMAVTIRKSIDGALDQWTRNNDLDMETYAKELTTLFDLATRRLTDPPP
jgi:AcrR family transcriptional regulator